MFSFFTDAYHNETFPSIISRYGYYSSFTSLKNTIKEVLGVEINNFHDRLPVNLNYFCNQFIDKERNSVDYFIDNHTNYRLYVPFVSIDKGEELRNNIIKDCKSKRMKPKIKDIAVDKSTLKYCPECSIEDIETYGETYFHRQHQINGVWACFKHRCLLRIYTSESISTTKGFLLVKKENINYKVEYEEDKLTILRQLQLAEGANFILNNDKMQKIYNKDLLEKKLIEGLYNNGYMYDDYLNVNQILLHDDFVKYYGSVFLKRFGFIPEIIDSKSTLLQTIFQKNGKHLNITLYILFIIFLFGDIKNFFTPEIENEKKFYNGEWRCLNPYCKYYSTDKGGYKEYMTHYYVSTLDPIIAYRCECEFTHLKKGLGIVVSDKNISNVITNYGHSWVSKFIELVTEEKYSIKQLAEIMKCDDEIILENASKLGFIKRNRSFYENEIIKVKR